MGILGRLLYTNVFGEPRVRLTENSHADFSLMEGFIRGAQTVRQIALYAGSGR
jgi:hypothetical protein